MMPSHSMRDLVGGSDPAPAERAEYYERLGLELRRLNPDFGRDNLRAAGRELARAARLWMQQRTDWRMLPAGRWLTRYEVIGEVLGTCVLAAAMVALAIAALVW